MARGHTHIQLVGTLVQDADLRYTPAGLATLDVNVAGNDNVIGDDGKERNLAWYHRATIFGPYAEAMADHLKAGQAVHIDGRLNYRSWENQEGQRRNALDIVADRIDTLEYGVRGNEPTVADAKNQLRLQNAWNSVTVIGNLTRDVELRYTPAGVAVANLAIAANERFRTRNSEEQERTHYVDITAWRDLAEGVAELAKGAPVMVHGRLTTDIWTNRDGNRRFTTKVEADRIEILTRPNTQATSKSARQAPTPSNGAQNAAPQQYPSEEDLPF